MDTRSNTCCGLVGHSNYSGGGSAALPHYDSQPRVFQARILTLHRYGGSGVGNGFYDEFNLFSMIISSSTNNGVSLDNYEQALFVQLLQMLPTAPANVIVVAQKADEWTALLCAQSYRATGMPWRDQCQYAQPAHHGRAAIRQLNFALPQIAQRRFDVVLVLDFSDGVHPLALFDDLDSVLEDDGVVILAGRRDEALPYRLSRWLEYVTAIGNRCGYVLQSGYEETTAPGQMDFLRAFSRGEPPRWRIKHMVPRDFPEVATLFKDVFGQTLSRELWEWKYGSGRGNTVIVRRNGALVAHYACMYRDILLCGQPDWAIQICDVMVHGKERGVLTRQGPFLLAAATIAEIYSPLGFGFPSQRHLLLAEKMGLYAEAGKMIEVRWRPAAPRFRLLTKVRHLTNDSINGRQIVDRLWQGMAHDLRDGVVGVRDWEYLKHRYFGHPHVHYEVLLVSERLTGKPLGVAVLRNHEGNCEFLDVIAPMRHLGPILDQIRRMGSIWGLAYIYCWITSNYASLFLALDGQQCALDICIPTSSWTDKSRADLLKGKWWLMSGDTDFH